MPPTPIAKLTKAQLRAQTEEILRFTTSKSFMDELDAVLKTPRARQLGVAATRFAPEALERVGLRAPAQTRISSRIFEEGTAKSRVLGEPSDKAVSINASLPRGAAIDPSILKAIDTDAILRRAMVNGWSACVCVGGGLCVGVGGGT